MATRYEIRNFIFTVRATPKRMQWIVSVLSKIPKILTIDGVKELTMKESIYK
jgi:hypothetical protein